MQAAAKKGSSNDKSTQKPTATLLKLNDPSIIPFDYPASATCIQQKPTCACGGGCPICTHLLPVQARLTIGQSGDRYELEADSVADRVMSMPEPQIRPKPS